jgi:hypothetical protein
MGNQPATVEGNDDASSVPGWSGRFTRLTEGVGMMLVHLDDKTSPPFPEGWHPVGDPIFEGDAVVWVLMEEAA